MVEVPSQGFRYFLGREHLAEFNGGRSFENWFDGVVEEPPWPRTEIQLRKLLKTVPVSVGFPQAIRPRGQALSLRQVYYLLPRVRDGQVIICYARDAQGFMRRIDLCRQAGVIQTLGQSSDQYWSQGAWLALGV